MCYPGYPLCTVGDPEVREGTLFAKRNGHIFLPLILLFMKKYECDLCGYVYDPAEGDPDNEIAPGTAFEDLPEDWVCPLCGAGKEDFSVL